MSGMSGPFGPLPDWVQDFHLQSGRGCKSKSRNLRDEGRPAQSNQSKRTAEPLAFVPNLQWLLQKSAEKMEKKRRDIRDKGVAGKFEKSKARKGRGKGKSGHPSTTTGSKGGRGKGWKGWKGQKGRFGKGCKGKKRGRSGKWIIWTRAPRSLASENDFPNSEHGDAARLPFKTM